MAIHTSAVAPSAYSALIVHNLRLVFGTNVSIHVLICVEEMRNVMFTTTSQCVVVLGE